MNPVIRKPLLAFHTWAGLTAGLVLLVVAVTGALMVFRPQLERRIDPQALMVQPGVMRLSLDELVATARTVHPLGKLDRIRYYRDPTMPVMVLFTNRDYVHLNPYTGTVLGIRARYGEGLGWIEGVHKYLFLAPATGETATGIMAIVYVALVLAGLFLWWPASRRALRAGLTLNRALTGRPWILNLHKTLGSYAALFILFSALSGAPIALDSLERVYYFLTGSVRVPPPVPPAQPAEKFAGFQAMAQAIDAALPGAGETTVLSPKQGLVTAYTVAADAPHPNARSYVWLDSSSGTVVRATPYAQASAGFRLTYWMISLHTGVVGGLAMQLLLLFGALSVPVLAYTGVASYLRRNSRRPANVLPATAVAQDSPIK